MRSYIQETFAGAVRWVVAGRHNQILDEGWADTVDAAEVAAAAAIDRRTRHGVSPQLSLWEEAAR